MPQEADGRIVALTPEVELCEIHWVVIADHRVLPKCSSSSIRSKQRRLRAADAGWQADWRSSGEPVDRRAHTCSFARALRSSMADICTETGAAWYAAPANEVEREARERAMLL